MTGPTGDHLDDHLDHLGDHLDADLDRLADVLALLDGDLDDRPLHGPDADPDAVRAAADRDHVATCPRCRAALRDLTAADETVRGQLAALGPVAGPLPDDLPARVAAALAGPGGGAATGQPVGALVPAAAGVPEPVAAEPPAAVPAAAATTARPDGAEADVVPLAARRRPPRLLQAAAGVALVTAVGLGATALGGGGLAALDGGQEETAGTAALPESQPGRAVEDGDTAGGGQGEAADATAGATGTGPDARTTAAAPTPLTTTSGTAYTAATLYEAGAALAEQAAAGRVPAASAAATAAGDDPLRPLRDDPGLLAGCLTELTGNPASVAVVDLATFDGRPAVVAVAATGPDGAYDVYAAGAGCRAGTADLLAVVRAGG